PASEGRPVVQVDGEDPFPEALDVHGGDGDGAAGHHRVDSGDRGGELVDLGGCVPDPYRGAGIVGQTLAEDVGQARGDVHPVGGVGPGGAADLDLLADGGDGGPAGDGRADADRGRI